MKACHRVVFFAGLLFLPSVAMASQSFSVDVNFGDDPQAMTTPVKILLLLTVLSLAPGLIIVATSFTRIVIVLAMLRHALGMPSTPPNMVLVALALLLTFFTMSPVVDAVNKSAYEPYLENKISPEQAVTNGMSELRKFMFSQTREKDLLLMLELKSEPKPEKPDDVRTTTLLAAFMVSELHTAFKIGFMIFLPFLVLDLMVAGILMALGMIMLPPTTVSLPLKILVFVMIDGWALLVESLTRSF